MTMQVDLRQLAVARPSSTVLLVRKRSWLLRGGLSAAIMVSFLGLVGWSARDHWLPAQGVTVVPVFLAQAEAQPAGTPVFQAAGWIEPRPTAVTCAALIEGVVEELLVVEGQEVAADQPLVKLLDTEARLGLREAEATLQLRKAERDAARAVLTAARRHLEQPVHLEVAQAEAEAALATLETEVQHLPFLIRAAEARWTLARQDLEGKKAAAEAIAGRSLQAAQSEFDSATAALAELQQRGPHLNRQQDAWRRKVEALRAQRDLKTDEQRAVDEATAHLAAAEARVSQARLSIEAAGLRLERTTVRAPIQGRVLALHSQPGQRVMGISTGVAEDASALVTLYDPRQLQVRVDVRLEDVAQVQAGQPVRIATAATRQPLAGEVLAVTSRADIQKNTLPVKVSIDRPPAVIRPEMLAQVTFLAPPRPGDGSPGEPARWRLLVPRELVDATSGGATIWVADASRSVARRRAIQLGSAGSGPLVEVTQGVSALDKLIADGREGLTDGARIRITGADRRLGAPGPPADPAPDS